jgi:hypothetical protein
MVGTEKGVDDRGARGIRDRHPPRDGQADPVGFEVGRSGRRLVDGEVPAIDQDVALSAHLPDHDVESVDVVASQEVLPSVVDGGEGGQHQIRLSGLAGRVRDGMKIPSELGDSSRGSPVPVRVGLFLEVASAHCDMDHVRTKAMQEIDDSCGDLGQSGEGIIAADHRGPERGVHPFQSFDDGGTEIPTRLVGDQQHESLIIIIDHVPSVG